MRAPFIITTTTTTMTLTLWSLSMLSLTPVLISTVAISPSWTGTSCCQSAASSSPCPWCCMVQVSGLTATQLWSQWPVPGVVLWPGAEVVSGPGPCPLLSWPHYTVTSQLLHWPGPHWPHCCCSHIQRHRGGLIKRRCTTPTLIYRVHYDTYIIIQNRVYHLIQKVTYTR